jgi:hypothetical protein
VRFAPGPDRTGAGTIGAGNRLRSFLGFLGHIDLLNIDR